MAKHAGGVAKLAAVLRVSRRTVNAWGHGVRPHYYARTAVERFCKEAGIAPPMFCSGAGSPFGGH
jgi:hypothetical protein